MLITLAAPAFAGTWYIENGDITVKASGTEGKNKVSQGNNPEVEDTDTIITNQKTDKASSHTVTIDAGNDKVKVTLEDVNIKADSGSALTSKGDVTLTLKGDNHLTGGNGDTYGGSGISSSGSLTISGGETDSLTAQGGSGENGGDGISSKDLTISGGTVTATGGNSTGIVGSGGSGIHSGGDVTISGGTVTATGGDSTGSDGSGGYGIYSSSTTTISGGTVNANGGSGKNGNGGNGIIGSGRVAISGGTVEAAGGNGSTGGGSGIYSSVIDLSGSLELTAKAGSPTGKALLQNGRELDLDTIKDKLDPGAKVTVTDANGKVNQVSIPRPVEPEESSSSSDGGSATPSAPASPLPGLTVTDKSGAVISYTSTQSGNTLTVCVGRFTASLRASLAALRQLRAAG